MHCHNYTPLTTILFSVSFFSSTNVKSPVRSRFPTMSMFGYLSTSSIESFVSPVGTNGITLDGKGTFGATVSLHPACVMASMYLLPACICDISLVFADVWLIKLSCPPAYTIAIVGIPLTDLSSVQTYGF